MARRLPIHGMHDLTGAMHEGSAATVPSSEPLRLPSVVQVRVVPPPGSRAAPIDRVAWLTPYEAENIGEDARRAGPGARLEIIVPLPTSEDRLAAVRTLFAWLAAKGVTVSVRAEEEQPPVV